MSLVGPNDGTVSIWNAVSACKSFQALSSLADDRVRAQPASNVIVSPNISNTGIPHIFMWC